MESIHERQKADERSSLSLEDELVLPLICSCKWGVDEPIFPVRCVEGWKLSPVSRVACYQEILRPKRMEMLGRGGSIIWCQSGRDSRGEVPKFLATNGECLR